MTERMPPPDDARSLPDAHVVFDDRRGMLSLLGLLGPGSPAERAARALLATRERLLICTGFSVAGLTESDGPPGAIVLARALAQLGRDVTLVTFAEAHAAFGPALDHAPELAVSTIARGAPSASLAGVPVTVEVCGRIAGGAYVNMAGHDIQAEAPWFESAVGTHALISIGDGGNEFGFGSAPPAWFAARGVRPPISTCDHLVVGQVSNWAALAVVASLARTSGRALLPSAEAYQALLEALAAGGVIDGVSRTPTPTEDGSPLYAGMSVVRALAAWVAR